MSSVFDSLGSARTSVKEASTDIGGRYGGDCKSVYTGSIPVVASTISEDALRGLMDGDRHQGRWQERADRKP